MADIDRALILSLRTDCLAWMALHHFLPAAHFRELMRVTVEVVSGGKLSLNQLFEEQLVESTYDFKSWIIKPIASSDPTAQYLQRRIRHLVWQHDSEAHPQPQVVTHDPDVNADGIETAIRLGRMDIQNAAVELKKFSFREGTAVHALVKAISVFSEAAISDEAPISETIAEVLAKANPWLVTVDTPLRAVVVKHIGDLCADSDLWAWALRLYDHTLEILNDKKETTGFTQVIETLAVQSKASALRIAQGPVEATAYLLDQLRQDEFNASPLLALNASHDAMVVEMLSLKPLTFRPDQRASILLPPQLLKSYDDATAMDSWAEGNYTAASQQFWAVLRRQIALGASSETRVTKVNYARNVYAELDNQKERYRGPGLFWMATRLLIESGQSDSAKKFSWSTELVGLYVDVQLIEAAIQHCSRNKGALLERNNVVVELFAAWAEKLPHDQVDVAAALLGFLARNARDGQVAFYTPYNIAGRCLELLGSIVQKRPEFRSLTSAEVLQAILSRLAASEFWKGQADALKLAGAYFAVLSAEQADQVVVAVLKLLAELDPTKDVWPIVQPAMDLLMSGEMPRLSARNPDLGREIVSTILRFGIGQQSEHSRLLFYLENFDLKSIDDPKLAQDLERVIEDVIAGARQINSSIAIYNICALLYGSKVSGGHGVNVALESFKAILTAPDQEIPSISLPTAYQVLTILSTRRQQIVVEAKLDEGAFTTELAEILDLVIAVWHRARKSPIIFASFSLPPPTKPNSNIIHNWAYASVNFGISIGRGSQILEVLAEVEKQPDLKDAIGFGRASRLGGMEIETATKERIAQETRDTFYAALGNRLLQLRARSGSDKAEFLEALVYKCFQVGPNGLDSGIFLLVEGIDPQKITDNPEFENYRTRLDQSHNRDLRLSLFPMLLSLIQDSN